ARCRSPHIYSRPAKPASTTAIRNATATASEAILISSPSVFATVRIPAPLDGRQKKRGLLIHGRSAQYPQRLVEHDSDLFAPLRKLALQIAFRSLHIKQGLIDGQPRSEEHTSELQSR